MRHMIIGAILATSCGAYSQEGERGASQLPVVIIDRDNVVISRSCIIEVGQTPIIDADGDGVLHIRGDNLTIDLRGGQVLRGAAANLDADAFSGIGVTMKGSNITLKGFDVSGYKLGVLAQECDGLTIDGANFNDNFRQRLKSTPQAEDSSDWLWPHANDNEEWRTNYGAAVCIEDSKGVTLREVRVRKGQNGIILDRVNESLIYDCDCSFLSGWGLAMWRSSGNLISRNAFDFCVRGYSHGAYNRGQDSAGILMFEQCSNNVIAENSATHCGDGVFGFAGKEALGEMNPRDGTAWYAAIGCNNNVFIGNDFSYAVAHGLELTFSFHNQIWNNRFVGNAICGIWGGYSQNTTIAENTFESNGDMAYGLERGGVNIEHGRNNLIAGNSFTSNKCGIHLWWDDDAGLAKMPWARANGVESSDNHLLLNRFEANALNIHLRQSSRTRIATIQLDAVPPELEADDESLASAQMFAQHAGPLPAQRPTITSIHGETRSVGQRANLAGREHIIMTEWGPYDHESPMLVREADADADAATHVYRLLGAELPRDLRQVLTDGNVEPSLKDGRIHIRAVETSAVVPYTLDVVTPEGEVSTDGLFVNALWEVWWFPCPIDAQNVIIDPREQRKAWLAFADQVEPREVVSGRLHLPFGHAGPVDVLQPSVARPERSSIDHFGTIATTQVKIPAGTWRFTTTSDDGVRVIVDGATIIDNWTWHSPTVDTAEIEIAEARTIDIRVEHFELDGHAVLSLDIEPVASTDRE